jgi:hypothetical protein
VSRVIRSFTRIDYAVQYYPILYSVALLISPIYPSGCSQKYAWIFFKPLSEYSPHFCLDVKKLLHGFLQNALWKFPEHLSGYSLTYSQDVSNIHV